MAIKIIIIDGKQFSSIDTASNIIYFEDCCIGLNNKKNVKTVEELIKRIAAIVQDDLNDGRNKSLHYKTNV